MVRHKISGFTIVELLIVIVVTSILATLVVSSFSNMQAKARDSRRDSDIQSIKKALEMYRIDNGVYPLVGSDNAGYNVSTIAGLLAPYLPSVPNDPLAGRSYQYVRGPVESGVYGIRIEYESKPLCKTGVKVVSGWWGVTTPVCE